MSQISSADQSPVPRSIEDVESSERDLARRVAALEHDIVLRDMVLLKAHAALTCVVDRLSSSGAREICEEIEKVSPICGTLRASAILSEG